MVREIVILAALLTAWNTAVFLLYGRDKRAARRGRRRTQESTLLLSALFLGAPGAMAGMAIWRHKTKKWRFLLGVPLALAANAVAYTLLWQWVSSW